MVLTVSSLNLPVWSLKKSDGSQRMTVNSHTHHQVGVLITVAVLAMMSLLNQINKDSGVWCLPLVCQMHSFPFQLEKEDQNLFIFIWVEQKYSFMECLGALVILLPSVIIYSC